MISGSISRPDAGTGMFQKPRCSGSPGCQLRNKRGFPWAITTGSAHVPPLSMTVGISGRRSGSPWIGQYRETQRPATAPRQPFRRAVIRVEISRRSAVEIARRASIWRFLSERRHSTISSGPLCAGGLMPCVSSSNSCNIHGDEAYSLVEVMLFDRAPAAPSVRSNGTHHVSVRAVQRETDIEAFDNSHRNLR